MAQSFQITRQPGAIKRRGLNNPRTMEAAIRSGEITPKQFEDFVHRPRLDKLLNSLKIYESCWGPLVPVDNEHRQKVCDYLRRQIDKTCDLILTNRVEDEGFRLFEPDEEAPEDHAAA